MSFGNLLSSDNIGTEFAKALTVKVPRSKYGLIEGLAMAQKKRAAEAKAGLGAKDDIDKLKVEAIKSVKDVDPKVADEVKNSLYSFLDQTDKVLSESSSAETAYPKVQRAFADFYATQVNIGGRSTLLKGIRSKVNQPNVLVPPTVTEFLNNKEAQISDDGLFHLPGWQDLVLANPEIGWMGMNLPKKKDISGMDVKILQSQPVSFFKANSEGSPAVSKKTIEGRTFEVTDYKLSRDAIRQQVLMATREDPDYLPNLSFEYYQSNRKSANFKQSILEKRLNVLDGSDPVFEEIVDWRTDQIYNKGVYKGDEISGSKPTSVNVTVGGDDKSRPALGSPFLSKTKIKQTLQDRSSQFASVFTFGNSISAGEASTLSVVEGTIDANTNEAFSASGSFDFKPSQIVIAPVYARAERANKNYDVQGKLVDTGAINSEFNNDNVVFEIFVQGTSTKEFTNANGITTKGAELFYPAQNFWASNQAAATKAQVSVGEAELKTMAELSSVRDMLNDKVPEAVQLFKQAMANDTDQNLQTRLVKLAYDKGYIDRYKKGNNFVPPQEMGRKGPGPGVQTKKPATQTKKDGSKPATNPAPKAAANKAAAPAKPAGLPQGKPRRTAKRESL
jgi:hypothetical protein